MEQCAGKAVFRRGVRFILFAKAVNYFHQSVATKVFPVAAAQGGPRPVAAWRRLCPAAW